MANFSVGAPGLGATYTPWDGGDPGFAYQGGSVPQWYADQYRTQNDPRGNNWNGQYGIAGGGVDPSKYGVDAGSGQATYNGMATTAPVTPGAAPQSLGMGAAYGATGGMGGTAAPYAMPAQQTMQPPTAMQQPSYGQPQQAQSGPASGGPNPYLSGMADEIGRRSNVALGQAFNGIRSNSIGVGGLGGSRQGVAQGVATGMANDALTGNLANLYGTDWTNSQNRGLQQYGMDQNFYTQQRGQDQSGAALGASLINQGQNGQWGPITQAAGAYAPFTGLGTTTQSQNTGGGLTGALGGALAGGVLSKNLSWF